MRCRREVGQGQDFMIGRFMTGKDETATYDFGKTRENWKNRIIRYR